MPVLPRRAVLRTLALLTAAPALARALPSSDFNPLDFGAKGDGSTLDTAALQGTLDACAKAGGGRVTLPAGHTFLSGTLTLRSGVDLHLQNAAILRASPNRDHFRALGALLFAHNTDDFTLSGDGTIDGNFHAFLKDRQPGGYAVPAAFLGPFDPLDFKPGRDAPDGRPRVILLVNCRNVHLRDFTIRDAPTWTIHLLGCHNVHVAGLAILNSLEVPNCDGIDIDHCTQVRVESCNIQAGDDCLVLKASRNFPEFGPCQDIVISDCTLRSSSAAIKVEPEGPDPVRRVAISNCTIERSNRGISILNRDGATIEDLTFADMVINTELQPLMWWGSGEPVHVSNLSRGPRTPIGTVRNLKFSNLICRGENGVYLQGAPGHPLQDLTLSNIDITIEKSSTIPGGFYDLRPGDPAAAASLVQHRTLAGLLADQVDSLTLDNIHIAWAGPTQPFYGPALALSNAPHTQLTNVTGQPGQPNHP